MANWGDMEFAEIRQKQVLLPKDENGREICVYEMRNVVPVGLPFYPNTKLHALYSGVTINPIKEQIMSLGENVPSVEVKPEGKYTKSEQDPVFFFVYNTDNYFHFVYDTLPYLISFLTLKKQIPNLRLLMGQPYPRESFYRFVTELLDIVGIAKNDIRLIDMQTRYSRLYVSTSYTHDFDSNLPPRKEIYNLYGDIVAAVKKQHNPLPSSNIYVSRRTWIHNDVSNIGTNYTTRRKLMNEDQLVAMLHNRGYKEVFTEQLSTVDKVLAFDSARIVVGAIGGGMCNALFSPNDTSLVVLVSPTFMDKHQRFEHSFTGKNTTYFTKASHAESGYWKRHMRVRNTITGWVGEIEEVNGSTLVMSYTDVPVAGWNSELTLKRASVHMQDCVRLDNGLNCNWTIDLKELQNVL